MCVDKSYCTKIGSVCDNIAHMYIQSCTLLTPFQHPYISLYCTLTPLGITAYNVKLNFLGERFIKKIRFSNSCKILFKILYIQNAYVCIYGVCCLRNIQKVIFARRQTGQNKTYPANGVKCCIRCVVNMEYIEFTRYLSVHKLSAAEGVCRK